MSTSTLQAAAAGSFKTLVADPSSLVTFYDNMPTTDRPDAAHYMMMLKPQEALQVSTGAVGSRRFRIEGDLEVWSHVPLNIGDAALREMYDRVETAFRAKTLTGVVYRTPLTVRRGRVERWWAAVTVVPFYFDFFA